MMIEKTKGISAVLISLIVLVLSTVALAGTLQVEKFNVEISGTDVEDGDVINVERGEKVDVDVTFAPEFDYNDVRVKAWLGGYEYDDVKDVSGIFDAEEGVTYKKSLELSIPEDIAIKDDDSERDTYDIRVEAYNDDDSIRKTFTLRVKEQRHRLAIQDIIVRPGSTVQAGGSLFTTVRVENMGDKKEEDIKVSVSIPDLGLSQRVYIDELTSDEEDDDEETSMSSEEMLLRIPQDAKTGFYPIEVDVSYNRGHDTVTATSKIFVQGTEKAVEQPQEAKTVVGTDATSKAIKQGEEVAYKVTIANMGSKPQVYSLEVSGEKIWGSSRVDPAFLKVQNDATGEMYVYMRANSDAPAGKNTFTLKVKADDTVVEEKTLTADVAAKEAPTAQVGGLRNALIIGFGVLVVLLIIIGLIVLFNRMGREEEPGEIPSSEGQAYY